MTWYAGPLSRAEAEALLLPAGPGAFLVRDSRSCPGELALSVAEAPSGGLPPASHPHGHPHHHHQQPPPPRISHYIINRAGGELRMGDRRFASLDELVGHYRRHRLDTTTLLLPATPGGPGMGPGGPAGPGGPGGRPGGAGEGSGGAGCGLTQDEADRQQQQQSRAENSGSGTLRRHKTRLRRTSTSGSSNSHPHQQQQQQQHPHHHHHQHPDHSSTSTVDRRDNNNGAFCSGTDSRPEFPEFPEARPAPSSSSRQQATLPRRSRFPGAAATPTASGSGGTAATSGRGGTAGSRTTAVTGSLVRALYDFDGKDVEDLPFRRGETLTVVAAALEGQWWSARNGRGRTGQIPMNYVEVVAAETEETQDAAAAAAAAAAGEQSQSAADERRRRGAAGGGCGGSGGGGGGGGGGGLAKDEVSRGHGGAGLLGVRVPVYARVVQERIPTPYDSSALRLKVGEVVKVVRVDVSGQWEGEVGGRRGFFPFTHVQLLPGPR